ncbi:MAG TPA: ABC transporter permease [Burkholderiaceae bacterium]|nr:ABC transporter permease [Burkholderiaceae bacterium]
MLRAFIAKELLALRRDPHALAVLFLMPTAFILVMSLALRDSFRLDAESTLRVLVVDEDQSADSRRLLELAAVKAGSMSVDAARAALRRRDADALAVVGAGFARALAAREPPPVSLLAEPGTPIALLERERGRWERALGTLRAEAALRAIAPMAADADLASQGSQPAVALRSAAPVPLTSVQQSVPAWLVFAMFFVALPVSTLVIGERQQGTLDRLRSLAVAPTVIVMGKLVPFYLVHLLQVAAMLAVGRWIVPLMGGDALSLAVDPFALFLVATATSIAALGLSLLIASFARTSEQATILAGGINIILGALGGIMVPKQVMPAAMQPITKLSPMGWGLDAFVDVFARQATSADVAIECGALVAFGAAALALGVIRLGRAA